MNEYPYPQEREEAARLGLPEEEALPRGETWLHERRNWMAEVVQLRATVEAQARAMEANILDEHEKLYELKARQDRIQFEREIGEFSLEKKAALDEFIRNSSTMRFDELDAVIGAFGDAEGTYVQSFKAGADVVMRWLEGFDPRYPTVSSEIEQLRAENATLRARWATHEKSIADQRALQGLTIELTAELLHEDDWIVTMIPGPIPGMVLQGAFLGISHDSKYLVLKQPICTIAPINVGLVKRGDEIIYRHPRHEEQ